MEYHALFILFFCTSMTEKYPLYPVEAEITFNKGGRFMSTKMKPEKLQQEPWLNKNFNFVRVQTMMMTIMALLTFKMYGVPGTMSLSFWYDNFKNLSLALSIPMLHATGCLRWIAPILNSFCFFHFFKGS